jgi:hypothetical protein
VGEDAGEANPRASRSASFCCPHFRVRIAEGFDADVNECLRDDGQLAAKKDGPLVPIARERLQAFVKAMKG